ncbi:MAG: hypothetical protein ACO1N9_01805 [Flavobacterium sp.]
MRNFSFIFSLATFVVTIYFLATDFPALDSSEGIIYLSIVVVLLLICITGVIINRPVLARRRYSMR